jgi:cell division protease FtsH
MTQAKSYSEATAQKIDSEIALLIDRAYQKAKKVLAENLDILHALTDLLIERETVMGSELDDLIAELRPDFDFFGRKNIKHQPKVAAMDPVEKDPSEKDAGEKAREASDDSQDPEKNQVVDETIDDPPPDSDGEKK